VVTEKPMADRLDSAREIDRACREAGVRLMINWPAAWAPGLWHAYELAKAGEIGKVYQILFRCAHRGPREEGCSEFFCEWLFDESLNGKGALTDYCCYGAAFCALMLGSPDRVAGVAGRLLKEEIGVYDNAVLTLQYPGAICLLEACWTQAVQDANPIVIRGDKGALAPLDGPDGSRLIQFDANHPSGIDLEVPPLPEERRCMASMFYHHLLSDRPLYGLCSPEISLMAQEIMERGVASLG
jgi:predicted dehydrogenase